MRGSGKSHFILVVIAAALACMASGPRAHAVCETEPDLFETLAPAANRLSCSIAKVTHKTAPMCANCFNDQIFGRIEASLDKHDDLSPDEQQNACMADMQPYYCKHSPWRNLTVLQRYKEFRKISASISSRFPKETLVCTAAAETVNLEPMTGVCIRGQKSLGLGQIDRDSFLGLFDGEPAEKAFTDAGNHYQWMKRAVCSGKYNRLRQVFDEVLIQDPAMQIGAIALLLDRKAMDVERTSGVKKDTLLADTLVFYHGNGKGPMNRKKLDAIRERLTKGEHAANSYLTHISECSNCLRNDPKDRDPLKCLAMASGEKYTADGKVCK